MSGPDSCGTCGQGIFQPAVTCSGSCGLAFHLTCTTLQADPDPATFDEMTWLCGECRLFLRVPQEVWIEIFGQLAVTDLLQIRLTCRAWKQLVQDSQTLRGRIAVNIDEDFRIGYVPEVPFAGKVILTGMEIRRVLPWWRTIGSKLVAVEMREGSISLATLVEMLRQTPLLKELALYEVTLSGYQILGMANANFQLDKLEKLTLDAFEKREFLPILFELFAKICPRLKYLAVTGNSNQESQETQEVLIKLVQVVEGTLRSIKLDVTPKILEVLTKLEKLQLKHVTILRMIEYNREAFLNFFRAHPSIVYLSICSKATQLLEDNSIGLLQLVTLKIRLGKKFTLNLGHMPTLRCLDVTAIGKRIKFGQSRTPNLRQFRLYGGELNGNNLADLLVSLPHLQLLELTNLEVNSSRCFRSLAQPFSSIKTLKIDESHLSEMLLSSPVRLCPNLENLELLTGFPVRDDIMRSIVKRFPKLKRLALECKVFGQSVEYIFEHHGFGPAAPRG